MHIHGGSFNAGASAHASAGALEARRLESRRLDEMRKKLSSAASEIDGAGSEESAWMAGAWAGSGSSGDRNGDAREGLSGRGSEVGSEHGDVHRDENRDENRREAPGQLRSPDLNLSGSLRQDSEPIDVHVSSFGMRDPAHPRSSSPVSFWV